MIDELFRESATNIRVTLAVETENDPYSHTVDTTNLASIPLKSIVTEVSPSSSQWKMPGIITSKTKQLILKKIHRPLIERSQKITVQGDDSEYYGYRVNGKMSIISEQGYIRVYIYIKKES